MTWQPFEVNFQEIGVKFLANAEIVVREAQVHGLMGAEAERQRIHTREEREDRISKGAICSRPRLQSSKITLLTYQIR